MNSNFKVTRSLSNLKISKINLLSSRRKNNSIDDPKFHLRSIKIKKTSEVVSNYTESVLPEEKSERLMFKPNVKHYVQLSPSPTLFDLRSQRIQKDIKSLNRIINYDSIMKKAVDVQDELRNMIQKNYEKNASIKKDEIATTFRVKSSNQKVKKFFKEVKYGNEEVVREMLLKNQNLVREVDSTEQTALHWACKRGYTKIVKLLIEFKASLTAVDIVGRKPEDIARTKGFQDVLTILSMVRRMSRQNSSIFYKNV